MNALVRLYFLTVSLTVFFYSAYSENYRVYNTEQIRFPIIFTENAGQWNSKILFASQRGSKSLLLSKSGLYFLSTKIPQKKPLQINDVKHPERNIPCDEIVFYEFVKPSSRMRVFAENKALNTSNFYIGKRKSAWREGVRNYKQVVYKDVWRNIDVAYEERDGKLVQTFTIHPGGKLSDIEIRISGGNRNEYEHHTILQNVRAFIAGSETSFSADITQNMSNSIGFASPIASNGKRIFLQTEFSTYFGGSSADGMTSLEIDKHGNIYLMGGTQSSWDFPLKNPYQPIHYGWNSIVISKFACDGKTLLFSTYFGGKGGWNRPRNMSLGINNSLYITGLSDVTDMPLTPSAFQKDNYGTSCGFISRFSENGQLLFSSYCGYRADDVCVDNNGFVYIAGIAVWDMPFISPWALQKEHYHPGSGYILKMSPLCDSVIYCTYFSNPDFMSIEVDKDGNAVVAGEIRKSMPFLWKNAFQDTIKGLIDVFIAKINRDGSDLIFSTYLGGNAFEATYHDHLKIDASGNIYLLGETNSVDYPVRNGYQSSLKTKPNQAGREEGIDLFITKLSPSGDLITSTYFGTQEEDQAYHINIDPQGNILVKGSTLSRDLPLVNPIDTTLGGEFIAVFDPALSSILFSTHWNFIYIGNRFYDNIDVPPAGGIYGDAAGYIYVTYVTHGKLQTFNAFQKDYNGGLSDGYISRLYVPLAGQDYLYCNISTQDTIIVTSNPKYILPEVFDIKAEIINNDISRPALNCNAEIILPPGLSLYPATQSAHYTFSPSALLPGQRIIASWRVKVDKESMTERLPIVLGTYYNIPGNEQLCPQSASYCSKEIVVLRNQSFQPELLCSLNSPDTIAIDKSGLSYANNPFQLSYTLHNPGQRNIHAANVVLQLPKGMSVETIPANDIVRTDSLVKAGGSNNGYWNIWAKALPVSRTARFYITIFDSLGNVLSACERNVTFPAIEGLLCSASGPASVRYMTLSGTYTPDPLTVSLTLTNPLDTARRMTSAEIDFSRAPHLALASGETAVKGPFVIYSGNKRYIEWNLRVVPPVSAVVSDTLRFVYRMEGSAEPHYCEWIITIDPVSYEATCLLASPDTLSLTGNFYQPNPFTIRSVIKNTGKTEAPLKTAELQISLPSALSVQQPLARALSPLAAGDSVVFMWDANALTSLFARDIDFTVTVTDTAGKTAALCAKSLFLPPVPRGLFCDLTAPDTLKYDVASDTYAPNPFSCSIKLENVLDTAQTTVEAEIDLTGAQHLELVSGETAVKQLPDIIARGQSSVAWNVTVQSSTDKPVTETILVRYRSANEQEWKTCERTIFIQGEKRIRSAKCSVKGHDTLWADIRYEDVIPQPAQIQYTITNTGNVPLTGCSAAIIFPAKYELEPGCDSVQTYGIIPPGMSTSREWFIVVNKSIALPGTDDIQWTWTCDDMTTEIPCRHSITLAVGIPHGITLTPWKLRFMAKQDGPLPASQKVKLWPGNGSPVFWQAQSALPWLDWQPQSGTLATPSEITVRPTTTSMPVGVYSGALNIVSTMQSTPPDVQVEYEIYRVLNVERKQSPAGFTLEQNYPNPVSGDRTAVIRFMLTEKSFAVLKLYDAFGRELMTLHSGETQAGTYSIRLDSSIREQLSAGVYYYTLNAGGRNGTRMMIVR